MNILIKTKDFLSRHKIIIIVSVIVFIIGYAAAEFRETSPYEDILKSELSKYHDGKWVVKINETPIGESYVNKRVELYGKHISTESNKPDMDIRNQLIEKLIDNYIVLENAKESGIFSSKEAQEYLWLYIEKAMVNYYLDFMVNSNRNKKINLTNKQIEDFYEKNKIIFDKKSKKKNKFFNIVKRKMDEFNERLNMHNKKHSRESELEKLKKAKKILYNK